MFNIIFKKSIYVSTRPYNYMHSLLLRFCWSYLGPIHQRKYYRNRCKPFARGAAVWELMQYDGRLVFQRGCKDLANESSSTFRQPAHV